MSAIMNMSTFAPTKVVAGQRQMRAARSATTVAAAVRPATFSGMHTKSLGFAASRTFSEKVTQKMSAIKTQGSRTVATMAKKSVGSLTKKDLEGKRVFVRADLNVPLDGDLNISDDTRIRAAVPTIKYLVDNGAKVLLTSHLGRPKDGPEDKFRLNPVVPRLSELLGAEVRTQPTFCQIPILIILVPVGAPLRPGTSCRSPPWYQTLRPVPAGAQPNRACRNLPELMLTTWHHAIGGEEGR